MMLNADAPERISPVKGTQFSIARFYGGLKFNGHDYVYNEATDTLTRADVLKREREARKTENRDRREQNKKRQGELL